MWCVNPEFSHQLTFQFFPEIFAYPNKLGHLKTPNPPKRLLTGQFACFIHVAPLHIQQCSQPKISQSKSENTKCIASTILQDAKKGIRIYSKPSSNMMSEKFPSTYCHLFFGIHESFKVLGSRAGTGFFNALGLVGSKASDSKASNFLAE